MADTAAFPQVIDTQKDENFNGLLVTETLSWRTPEPDGLLRVCFRLLKDGELEHKITLATALQEGDPSESELWWRIAGYIQKFHPDYPVPSRRD